MDFVMFAMYAGQLRGKAPANLLAFDEGLLERCAKALGEAGNGHRTARVSVDGYPELEVGFGAPKLALERLRDRGEAEVGEQLFWLAKPAGPVLTAHLVVTGKLQQEIEDRALALLVAASGGQRLPSEYMTEMRTYISDARPALVSTTLSPISEQLTRRTLPAVREVSRHLARVILER